MYKCISCNATFQSTVVCLDTDVSRYYGGCPHCSSDDIALTATCAICGNDYVPEFEDREACPKCDHDVCHKLAQYMLDGMTTYEAEWVREHLMA